MFDETYAQRDGTIRRETRFPEDAGQWVLSGPHFFVGTPLYKTPRAICTEKGHYDSLDLTHLPDDYLPRTNYVPDCSPAEYAERTPKMPWVEPGKHEGKPVTECFRFVNREMLSQSGERTGRIVFTPSKGLVGVGLPRKARKADLKTGICYGIQTPERQEQDIPLGWEDIRDLPAGCTVAKTFPDDTLPGGPVQRTIEYQPPFVRPDREEDYRIAWAFFEREQPC
jgi:hypothetical protein